jgi:hypothetical protein
MRWISPGTREGRRKNRGGDSEKSEAGERSDEGAVDCGGLSPSV